jgi:hypothetical protein
MKTDVSEVHTASIFRVEELTKQETSMAKPASRACDLIGFLFDTENGDHMLIINLSLFSSELNGVTSQKATSVKTSN